ncbi:hypothetical protein EYF80_012773 [Liparis tanakae]|uniref:Uncharacterized protein n=1 Tax=Liparis tanakae TaxID=230148 RepID=A0A4Z2IGK7_9TELE|nr:hypothetical protein EYF80_012773 [Liparis tanakae]
MLPSSQRIPKLDMGAGRRVMGRHGGTGNLCTFTRALAKSLPVGTNNTCAKCLLGSGAEPLAPGVSAMSRAKHIQTVWNSAAPEADPALS